MYIMWSKPQALSITLGDCRRELSEANHIGYPSLFGLATYLQASLNNTNNLKLFKLNEE